MTRYTYDNITKIYTGTTNDNLPNSTELVPTLTDEKNTARFVSGSWIEVFIDKTKIYRYNIDKLLVTVNFEMIELTALSMTDAEANHCIGFDDNGNPLYDTAAIQAEIDIAKEEQAKIINVNFNNECENIGVEFIGTFPILNSEDFITDPRFQYDDLSQQRLFRFKDVTEVNFWRSVHSNDSTKNNANVQLTNEQKNELYGLLLYIWAIKFAEKSAAIDQL